jgi:hypothetical protein
MAAKLTKQGIRDLDAVAPKQQRGHVGTPKRGLMPGEGRCHHIWEQDMGDGNEFPRWVCEECGAVRG